MEVRIRHENDAKSTWFTKVDKISDLDKVIEDIKGWGLLVDYDDVPYELSGTFVYLPEHSAFFEITIHAPEE